MDIRVCNICGKCIVLDSWVIVQLMDYVHTGNLQVVRGLVTMFPFLDVWVYGNYVVSSAMLSKVFLFHVIVALIMFLIVAIHIRILHTNSSNSV